MVICLMALTNMGVADFAASSAARFNESMVLSTRLPNPNERNVFSAFFTSGGIRIFTAASAKKPSTALNLLVLFCVPIVSACFKPSITCDCVGPEVDVVGKEPAACCKVVQE